MTSNIPLGTSVISSAPPAFARAHVLQASGALLAELEASLRDSQRALLALDLVGIEQGTRDQKRLQRALKILWGVKDGVHDAGSGMGIDGGFDGADATELRAAAMQVLHLGRVQAVLLARAQRSLRMIARLLAGAGANYLPPVYSTCPSGAVRVASHSNEETN